MRELKRQSRGVVTSFCLNFDLSLGSKVRGQRRHESQTQPDTRHVYLFHIKQTKFNTMCEMSIMSILVCIYNYIFQFYIYIYAVCCCILTTKQFHVCMKCITNIGENIYISGILSVINVFSSSAHGLSITFLMWCCL